MQTEMIFTTVTAPIAISKDTILNLLNCAIDGGSVYWCQKIRTVEEKSKKAFHEYWENGFYVFEESSSDDTSRKKIVTPQKMKDAIQLMATKYPEHFKNALEDHTMDADTGDCFLQLATFGKIVYC